MISPEEAELEDDAPQPNVWPAVSAEHLANVGRAILLWNDLELHIDRAIWRILNVQQAAGACLTAQYNSVFSRIRALICLIDLFELSPEAHGRLKSFQGSLSSLNERRNRLVHDPRFLRERDQKVLRWEVTGNARLSFQFIEEGIPELQQFFAEVAQKKDEFISIWKLVRTQIEERPELLRKRFAQISLGQMEDLDHPTENEERPPPPLPLGGPDLQENPPDQS